jgi:hypothetical protein
MLVIREALDGKFEKIPREPAKMDEEVKEPRNRHESDQRALIETIIWWVAVKSISVQSISPHCAGKCFHQITQTSLC